MPDWVVWVIIGVVAAGLLAALIVWLIKFFRKTPQERKEIVINFLIGLVTMAEEEFKDEHGKGAEKLKMVEEALKYNKVESILEDGEQEDIFSPEYFEKLSDVKMPASKL